IGSPRGVPLSESGEIARLVSRLVTLGFGCDRRIRAIRSKASAGTPDRSEEHTSELQSRENLVCRLLLEKKKKGETNHDRVSAASAVYPASSYCLSSFPFDGSRRGLPSFPTRRSSDLIGSPRGVPLSESGEIARLVSRLVTLGFGCDRRIRAIRSKASAGTPD